jgi:hypothetical protein
MSLPEQDELLLVYRTANRVEAGALAARLEDAEIEAQIIGDFRDTAYPGLFVGTMADKEVWVAKRDEAAASTIVDQWKREHHPTDVAPPRGGRPFSLLRLFIVLMIAAVVIGIVTSSPWSAAAGAIVNAVAFAAYLYFATRRLQQKRQALIDDEAMTAVTT